MDTKAVHSLQDTWTTGHPGVSISVAQCAVPEAFSRLRASEVRTVVNGAQLLEQTLASGSELADHRLNYDGENNLIWITNPYGVDSGVLQPTEQACQEFIERISLGYVYGPCPE